MAGRKNQKSSTQKRDLKQETTWKNNLFARYILFRYSLALLFFANIYWIMILSYQLNVIIILPYKVNCSAKAIAIKSNCKIGKIIITFN